MPAARLDDSPERRQVDRLRHDGHRPVLEDDEADVVSLISSIGGRGRTISAWCLLEHDVILGEKLGKGWLSQLITRMKYESLEASRAIVCCQT